jgi:hypothetical protein
MGRFTLLAWASAALVSTLVSPAIGGGGMNVVVNARNTVESLSPSEIKRLVSGSRKTWDGGVVVQLGVIPGDAPETVHLAGLLETSTRELMALIQQQVFKGELRRPVVLRSSADCASLAASNVGALCIAATGTPIPAGARVVPVQ